MTHTYLIEFPAELRTKLATSPYAELDLLNLEWQFRPTIFTLIDGNNVKKAREMLQADGSRSRICMPGSGWTPLHLAASLGRINFIHLLVTEFGMDPNARCGANRCTPLHQATIGQRKQAMETLLDLGADINAIFIHDQTNQEFTSLEVAVHQYSSTNWKQNKEVIQVLLSRGADYLRNFCGTSPASSFLLPLGCSSYSPPQLALVISP